MPSVESSNSLVDEIVEKLEVAIFRGEYPPGTRIREARVAAQLGIKPGPVREALRRLEGRRIVVRHLNLGSSVVKLTPEELLDLLEVWELLQIGAGRLAVERMDENDLAGLRRIVEAEGNPLDSRRTRIYSEWHTQDFHYQIVLASRNRRLIDLLYADIWILLRAYRHPGALSPGRLPSGKDAHRAILAALEARDADACEKAMKEHYEEFRAFLAEHFKRESGKSARTRKPKAAKVTKV